MLQSDLPPASRKMKSALPILLIFAAAGCNLHFPTRSVELVEDGGAPVDMGAGDASGTTDSGGGGGDAAADDGTDAGPSIPDVSFGGDMAWDRTENCRFNKTCKCGPDEACQLRCDGSGCNFVCEPGSICETFCANGDCKTDCRGATCNARCGGGECELNCRDGATCTGWCWGGACTGACTAGSDCQVNGCPAGCEFTCDGSTSCKQECESDCTLACLLDTTCELDCSGGGCICDASSGGTCN